MIKAIKLHIDQIGITMTLMLFTLYTFSIWLMEYFQNEPFDDEQMDCSKLYNCFLYIWNYGLRMGGGIGEYMKVFNPQQNFYHYTIYEIIFFLLINIMFLNVIFGIIIDTFSQLREESNQRKRDHERICFVCGLSRANFCKNGRDFDYHIDKEHTPWKYIYYIYYLEEKGTDNFTGLEQMCWNKFEK